MRWCTGVCVHAEPDVQRGMLRVLVGGLGAHCRRRNYHDAGSLQRLLVQPGGTSESCRMLLVPLRVPST